MLGELFCLILYASMLYFSYWVIRFVLLDCFMEIDVRGRSIVVIGSTTGFGHDFTLKCVKKGMTVFAGCNSPSGIELLQKECEGLPGKVLPFRLNVTSQESVEEAYEFVRKQIPEGEGIMALVNNAGIARIGADEWLTMEDYDAVWQVNTLGLIRTTKKFLGLVKMAKGRIVFCSSMCGRLAFPYYGPYTVAKFGLEAYADTIRRELDPFGVKVSIVEPGFFRTPLTTAESLATGLTMSFNQAPVEIQQEYGGEGFLQNLIDQHSVYLNSMLNSPHVEWVTDSYFHAVVSPFPKKRYVVGIDANLMVFLIAGLPTILQDFYIRTVYSLANILPTPRASSRLLDKLAMKTD